MNQISLIIPSHNNLRHLKNAYESIRKHAPQDTEIILIDDASTDETYKWIKDQQINDKNLVISSNTERLGHTILYDTGIEMSTNKIVGILHADMIIGPNYIKNMIKHLKPGTVVAGTRIEPPLHPSGNEKIIENFGLDFNDLDIEGFESFCLRMQKMFKGKTSKGMFAPWIIYKEDFINMGGHDHIFAPFPYEDSDIFERWILSGYNLIQSRDAFVYHLTCRGHRWTSEIGKDDDYFKKASQRAAREYLRKWGSWIKNDEYQHPIIKPKYNIGYVINGNCGLNGLATLEPMCDNIYIEDETSNIIKDYLKYEQPNTKFNLNTRVKHINEEKINDIIIEFNFKSINENYFKLLQQLPEIIKESGEIGIMELEIFKLTINSMTRYEKEMIKPIYKIA
jgi:glycosyltransferase involved in cell wall biosynthesis